MLHGDGIIAQTPFLNRVSGKGCYGFLKNRAFIFGTRISWTARMFFRHLAEKTVVSVYKPGPLSSFLRRPSATDGFLGCDPPVGRWVPDESVGILIVNSLQVAAFLL